MKNKRLIKYLIYCRKSTMGKINNRLSLKNQEKVTKKFIRKSQKYGESK